MVDEAELDLPDDKWFKGKYGHWASWGEKEKSTLCELLRQAYHEWKKDGQPSEVFTDYDVSEYTWDKSTDKLLNQLNIC